MVWFDLVRTFALWALWIATSVSITTVQTIDSCVKKKAGYFTKSSCTSFFSFLACVFRR